MILVDSCVEPCCCVFTSAAAAFSDAFLAAASPFSPTGRTSPVAGTGEPDCVAASTSDKEHWLFHQVALF